MRVLRLAAILALAATVAAGPAAAQTKVIVMTGFANDYLATWIAQDKGFATQRGVAFDIQLSQATGSDVAAALYANTAQIAQTTATTLALANENGLDLVIVAGAGIQTEVNPRQVLVRPAANVKRPKISPVRKSAPPKSTALSTSCSRNG